MSLFNSSKAQLVRQAKEWFRESQRKSKDWRNQAEQDFEFYAGEQWSEQDRAFLRDNNRPVVTFNRIAPTIDSVTGAERANRQEVRYLPRTLDDSAVNDQFTEVARWVRDEADAEDEESEAFLDALITGVGCTETWIDFKEEPDGKIRIERVCPLELYWDPRARKKNLSDAEFVIRIKRMSRRKIREIWPNKRLTLDGDGFRTDTGAEPRDADEAKFYRDDDRGRKQETNEINVAQLQWRETRPVFRVQNPETGNQEFLTPSEVEAVEAFFEQEIPKVRQVRWEYYEAFLVGSTLLEKRELHKGENDEIIPGFTFKFVTGKRDEVENQWFGLLRAMKDPQMWANKFFSQMQEILNSNAKGGIIAEKDAFDNARKAEEDWAKPDRIIWANPGAIAGKKIEQRNPSQMPVALAQMLEFAIAAVRDTSGVTIELLGLAERTQSGVVEQSRIQQGLITLNIFFDALRRYRKEQGRVLLHFINTYVDEGTIIRVVGQDQFVQFSKDPNVKRFDIIVDQSPTSPNMKTEVWQSFQTILPAWVRAGLPIPPDILDYAPLPASAVQKFKQFFSGQAQSQQQQQKIALETAMAELEKLKSEAGENQAQAIENIASAIGQLMARENDAQSNQIEATKVLGQLLVDATEDKNAGSTDRDSGSSK